MESECGLWDEEVEVDEDPEPEEPPTEEPVGEVNVNTPSKEELMGVAHIGKERAEEIIEIRPFAEFGWGNSSSWYS